ncbi:NEDD8-activating enzyme E1 regulatory subunit [Leucosporidium creatinivorum]|uniref:NEDD8-activating enzyme E1 regulatory subunit n=1 Tax=Leucosporidium creatinivorum TaxID=106004 RepID=A0A1Y2FW19_9BASI|nr:NEDD8-activating enzyme E1 regulatory subunit [Leucosporidium creatinivorum]
MATDDVLPPPVQDALPLAEAIVTAPQTSARPDAHTQRYDRQLRLWASSGQSALESANILVINGSATGSSTLKNLVLPGIGKFTILDPAPVDGSDIGNNFFLEPSSLGKPRAEEVSKYLLELNSDVKGEAIVQDLSTVLLTSPEQLASYSLIIAVNVDPTHLLPLSDIAWNNQIPFLKVRTVGFYGSLRVQVNEIAIVETHPESLIDLRVHSPFPALIEYANKFDYSTMNSQEHGHVPAVVILVKALEEWRASHDGKGPSTTAERKEFSAAVLKQKRNNDEENFDEAVTYFRRAGTKHGIPSEIQALFDDPACQNISASSPNFWLLLHAVHLFTQHPSNPLHLLPLSGSLPDMKADTTGYVGLQSLYKSKAKEDLKLVIEILGEVLKKVGVDGERVGMEEVETFVKHAAFLKVVRGRGLRMEEEESLVKGELETLRMTFQSLDPTDDSLSLYLGLLSSEKFFLKHGRYPGVEDSDVAGTADVEELKSVASEVVKGLGGEEVDEELEKVLKEICRAGASDLPQIAALMGGIVAQEVIKLITKQYIPLEGTMLFNGIKSTTRVLVA